MYGGYTPDVERIKQTYLKDIVFDARFEFALFIYDLQNSGYPLSGNLLTIEQWKWLGELKRAITEKAVKDNGK